MRSAIDEVLAEGSAKYDQFFAARTAARAVVASLLDCHPDEVALTNNTSSGLELVAGGLDWREGDEVVLLDRDFPANVQPWRRLADHGVRLRWVPMRAGGYELTDLAAALGARTRLVAVSHVNFRTGFCLNLDQVCSLAAESGAMVCVDAAQSLGVLPISLATTPVDFLAAGGYKWLCGPPGTGVFYCRRERLELLRRAPLGWFGYDGSDELFGPGGAHTSYDLPPRPAARRFEGGMLNFIGILGLATAVAEVADIGITAIWSRVCQLTDRLRAGLLERGYELISACGGNASGIVSFTAGQREEAHIHAALSAKGCQCSYVGGVLRASPHYWTTEAEVDMLLELLSSH
jgi:selenocysteine lyase/cysteine desulfurase